MCFISPKVLRAILCGAALALLGSCRVTEISEEEQSASLVPHSDLEIDGAPLEEFFRERTATLIGSRGMKVIEREESATSTNPDGYEPSFTLEMNPGERFSVGTAFAIDPRGYFLTAGHCLDGSEVYASFVNDEKKLVMQKVRPVWVKISSMTAIDLALFHVEGTPLETFQWAESLRIGETVFSAGATFEKRETEHPPFLFTTEGFAGELKKARYQNFEKTRFEVVEHKSPVRRGNSGGPLVNENGQLVGVNYAAATPIQRAAGSSSTPLSFAIRPDRKWLRDLIEEDWAKQQAR